MGTITVIGRTVIRARGPDAERLLHDTLTARIAPDLETRARWFALLTPQGKILAEGLVTLAEGAFWFDLPLAAKDEFLKRMLLYRLRAKVAFEDLGLSHRVGRGSGSGDGPGDGPLAYDDPREARLGRRVIAPVEDAAGWTEDEAGYAALRIEAGIAELGQDFAGAELFPHDIAMDEREGIDFVKGCYVGQEVVSRMKHRGTARRRPVIVRGAAPLEKGAALTASGRPIGNVTSVAGSNGLAIARIDRVADPADARAGEVPARLDLPAWASYALGAPAGGAGDEAE